MKITTMRLVDRWMGRPICFFLTAVRRLGDLFSSEQSAPGKVESILIVKLAEQGATVLAFEALKRAVGIVGRENVYFLVFEQNRFILDVMDVIPQENVVTIRTDGFGTVLVDTIRALRRVRKLHISAAVDFEFFARSSAILSYLSGAKIRVGFHSFAKEGPWRGDLMTHQLSYNPHIHTSQTFRMMVDVLNGTPQNLPALDMDLPAVQAETPAFAPSAQELKHFKEVVQTEAGTADYRPLILLNPNASDLIALRRWPSERYGELAERLLEASPNVHVGFTGPPEDAEGAERLVKAVGNARCFSMAGKTTLRELMTLYHLADLLVTNDSGPAHFATLTPIQVIALFGPETPKLFGAHSPRFHAVFKAIPCSPCVSAYNNRFSTCTNNVCMQRITVDEILELSKRLCKL